MDILYSFQGLTFEWDANKAKSNLQKHGVTFEDAAEAFFDPFFQRAMRPPRENSGNSLSVILFRSNFYWLCMSTGRIGRASFLRARPIGRKGNCMKKPKETLMAEEGFELHPRPRPAQDVTIRVPDDALASLRKVAESRDMAVEALMRLYVGQGLRNDLARQFGERVIEKTAQVLSRHLTSEEEISAILQEIRVESAA